MTEADLTALVGRWRREGARCDSFHATMGAGWKACADELEAALAGAGRQQAEWQPIDTAPKDGTRVLVVVTGDVFIAHWSDEAAFERCETKPGWQIFASDGDCWYAWAVDDATHWMPLPSGPLPAGDAEP